MASAKKNKENNMLILTLPTMLSLFYYRIIISVSLHYLV